MRIGIYSGSFNPVHVGHVALCDYLVREGIVDAVWLIRTPQNPLKQSRGLMSNELREQMLRAAIEGHEGLEVSTIEDELPVPNYTVRTLQKLRERYPEHEFSLIIGADNWLIFDKWREWDTILKDFKLVVYPRPGYGLEPHAVDFAYNPTHVRFVEAPQYDISSTEIRKRLAEKQSLEGLVDKRVEEILLKKHP